MTPRHAAVIVIALVLAAMLQGSLSARIAIGPARPDFIIVTVACLGLLNGFGRGVSAGLLGGFLMAALCGMTFGSFMVSRAAAGALMGSVPKDIQRGNALLPLAGVVVATLVTEAIYFVMAPVSPLRWWLKIVATEALYNMALALPIYWLVVRSLPKPTGKPAFAMPRR